MEPLIRFELMTYGLRNAEKHGVSPMSYKTFLAHLGQVMSRLQAARLAYLKALEAGNPYRDARALDLAEVVEALEDAVEELLAVEGVDGASEVEPGE